MWLLAARCWVMLVMEGMQGDYCSTYHGAGFPACIDRWMPLPQQT